MMVFLRGTSGCGKSTAVRWFLENLTHPITWRDQSGKVEGYQVELPSGKILAVVGRYETACGGLDGVKSFALVLELVAKYYQKGDHQLFERLTGSDVAWGTLGPGLEKYNCHHAFMDTPIELCLDRVRARREQKGNFKPFNEENTRNRTRAIWRAHDRLKDEFHQPVSIIDHCRAPWDILELLGEYSRSK